MKILLWKNFKKKRNSTKLPSASQGVSLDVNIKESTNIENPVFILRSNDFSYNYAQAFDHFYFITNIVSLANGLIEIHCEQDVLATYRSDIFNSSQYIAYASNSYDKMMFDSRCTMTGEVKFTTRLADIPNSSTSGMYVLTVLNDLLNETFTSTYLVTPADLGILSNELMDPSIDWANFFHASFDYINAVVSCRWIPFSFADGELQHATQHFIYIGNKTTGARGLLLGSDARFLFKGYFNVPFEYDDFRKMSPYSDVTLYIPYYGVVPISSSFFAKNQDIDRLWYWFSLDLFTGDISVSLDYAEREHAGTYQIITYNVGVDVPIAQMRSNVAGTVSDVGGIANSVGSIFSGNLIGGAVSAVSSLVNLGMDSQNPITSVKGGIQGRSMSRLETKLAINVKTNLTIEPTNYDNRMGRPIAEVKTVNSFTMGSFLQCEKASIDIAGLAGDKEAVNSFLNGGFYME